MLKPERLIVGLNTDEFIEEYKGKKPIFHYKERVNHLLATGYVNGVIKNKSGKDSKPTIEEIKPKVIAIGSDWFDKDYGKQMGFDGKWLQNNGISLVYIPYTQGISSTLIKERLHEN